MAALLRPLEKQLQGLRRGCSIVVAVFVPRDDIALEAVRLLRGELLHVKNDGALETLGSDLDAGVSPESTVLANKADELVYHAHEGERALVAKQEFHHLLLDVLVVALTVSHCYGESAVQAVTVAPDVDHLLVSDAVAVGLEHFAVFAAVVGG